jgi:hypothetical protein
MQVWGVLIEIGMEGDEDTTNVLHSLNNGQMGILQQVRMSLYLPLPRKPLVESWGADRVHSHDAQHFNPK